MKKAIIILTLILVSSISYGQSESLPNPEAYFSAIIVSDIESSITWYSNNFGFKVLNKIESEERGFKQANLKCGNILIELIELKSSVSRKSLLKNHPKKTKIDGFFKFGFLVSEFEKWVDHLKQAKVEFYGSVVTDNLSGKKMLLIKDPDGNRIQLFEK
ncbi:VOC family protein [Kordia sp. YSTF-M3]|uniref:VOC family protein n=1 Tax=Kordia aestuariivivens TaxID=2759037 RepID=A0ABR7Q8E3_9FLAO|nr:VOC family protein [Kordia aestuariivivens]MBC8754818.1 VOC family protein [Kordia aestuariivivens]